MASLAARATERSLPLAIAAVTALVFSPVLGGTFLNWDDDRSLLTNTAFRGLGPDQLRWMFTTTLLGHYAPLTWLSFGVTHAIAGMAPWAYRLGNVALHATNAALVFLVARHLLAAARPGLQGSSLGGGAAVAALLFGIHPLRVESVGWITDRGDLLCGTFYLLAVVGYLRAVAGPRPARWRGWRTVSLAAFAAALLSKEIAMTLPLSLLLLDAYPLRRWHQGARALLADKVPYLALAAGGAALALFARSQGADWTSYAAHGLAARLAMAAYSLAFYPLKLAWPAGLSPLYELPRHVSPLQWRFLAAAAGVLAVTTLVVAGRRRAPGAAVAWLHAAIAVGPVSGVLHAGSQLVADRYSYLPGLGFAMLAGGGAAWALETWRSGRLRASAAGVLAGAAVGLGILATLSWQHSWRWRDSVSLWTAALAVDDDCTLCHAKLGHALLAAGAAGRAEPHLRRAIDRLPDRAGLRIDLGVALAMTDRHAEAEREFQAAIRLEPSSIAARTNLAVLYAGQGRLDAAEASLREAVAARPHDAQLQLRLGQTLVSARRPGDAAVALERAVALAPQLAEARLWLARAYLDAHDAERAAPHIAVLRRLDPAAAAGLVTRP